MKKGCTYIILLLSLISLVGCGQKSTSDIKKTDETKIEISVDEEDITKDKFVDKTETDEEQNKADTLSESDVTKTDGKLTETSDKDSEKPASNTDPTTDKDTENKTPENTPSKEETAKPSTGSTEGTTKPTSKPSTATPTPTPTQKPSTPAHTHTWVEVTESIPHEEVGHWETKVIKEAWTETVKGWVTRCSVCQLDMTNFTDDELTYHVGRICGGRYSTNYETIATIPHEAETEDVWVIDQEAYTETKVIGYKCDCGATK